MTGYGESVAEIVEGYHLSSTSTFGETSYANPNTITNADEKWWLIKTSPIPTVSYGSDRAVSFTGTAWVGYFHPKRVHPLIPDAKGEGYIVMRMLCKPNKGIFGLCSYLGDISGQVGAATSIQVDTYSNKLRIKQSDDDLPDCDCLTGSTGGASNIAEESITGYDATKFNKYDITVALGADSTITGQTIRAELSINDYLKATTEITYDTGYSMIKYGVRPFISTVGSTHSFAIKQLAVVRA